MDLLNKLLLAPFKGQTYLNLLYLLLSFPLGLIYFVFLITGVAVGIPLSFLLVGLVILFGVFLAWYGLILFERKMAIWLLHEDIPPVSYQDLSRASASQRLVSALTNPVTWKGLAYLGIKFPLGTVSFVALVTLISLSAGLLLAPLFYSFWAPQVNSVIGGGAWVIDTLPEALLASLVGILMTIISLNFLNGLAWISGKFARVMLGNFSPPPTASVQPASSEGGLPIA